MSEPTRDLRRLGDVLYDAYAKHFQPVNDAAILCDQGRPYDKPGSMRLADEMAAALVAALAAAAPDEWREAVETLEEAVRDEMESHYDPAPERTALLARAAALTQERDEKEQARSELAAELWATRDLVGTWADRCATAEAEAARLREAVKWIDELHMTDGYRPDGQAICTHCQQPGPCPTRKMTLAALAPGGPRAE